MIGNWIVTKRVEKDRENGKRRKDSIRKYGILNDSESGVFHTDQEGTKDEEKSGATERCTGRVGRFLHAKMEPTEYAYFYRLMERMEKQCGKSVFLVRDDRLEKLEANSETGLESGEADVW